ncbi:MULTISPECIES: hypothetical protein [Cryobacterium]|uniref:Major facilitator superfamily (MFS) profile domain-containing protein n=1 Tax=Cryobacterium breve TaxID=1259258 RepID=A0ABY2J2W5_9MICO|nr:MULTISPECIES: hypothetical protein [Cryobacterium]TFC94102.1 hypothetical protein E3T20_09035 [Cryobacterium sp. TmT3-12]TFC98667.1 hypothetical protein E3O65_07255 [Cryobacterium breve]
MATYDSPNSDRSRETNDRDASVAAVPADNGRSVRDDVVDREKARFGGIKWGSAFFGWLTATGTAVILTALFAGIGTVVGFNTTDSADQAAGVAADNAGTLALVGAIALAVVVFVSYFCGGYVAGRMARFNGVKQGVAVWVWALIIAFVTAIIGAIAGSQINMLENVNSLPSIPLTGGDLTAGSIITALVVVLVSLAGAIVGGLAGMRFHRRVDREGLGR